MAQLFATLAGEHTEARVQEVLQGLPSPWQILPTIEWWLLNSGGTSIGEAMLKMRELPFNNNHESVGEV